MIKRMKSMGNRKQFKHYTEVLTNLKDIIQEDIMTSVVDTERFIGYFPGDKMRVEIKLGDKIPENDPLRQTIKTNSIIQAVVPKEVYGIPFKAVTFPLRNKNGDCIGAVGYAKSLEKEFLISESLNEVQSIIQSSFREMKEMTACIVDITDKTQDNSSAIEEVFASMQEMSSITQMINAITSETKNLNENVQSSAIIGNESVREIITSVNEISSSSRNVVGLIGNLTESTNKIGDIVNMINQISEQTNMLALNAAIEAARAGEHGKGFAVVADEVRKLAEQSKSATLNITQLISSIQQNINNVIGAVQVTEQVVENGVSTSQNLADNFTSIIQNIKSVDGKIEEIASKSNMKMEMVGHVTSAIESISSAVDETASSAESVSEAVGRHVKGLENNIELIDQAISKLTNV